ncbi:threonine/serine exporter family protein [Saccharibacillus sp. CPCC 101409]|uniref:threonine/serine exporter family protein n=1 Tax=Saccharibacillus sp. CPCC 101409 TaxID=3058041 RepID=UPI00267286A4|nr:threonine/serine exporter family protein [Saccharibacillus sp. CPCC 101409]MDO3410787.1 threonine/serine exporter family protein [Saccharibacillus sp. CPCC 101409]
MWAQLMTSFVAAATFVILFNAPKKSLLQCGLVGMLGWLLYILLRGEVGEAPAVLSASLLVGILCQLFARFYRTPVIIFSVAGIIPLVPGGMAYNAMRQFVENRYTAAIETGAETIVIAGAIAVGLVLSEVLNQMLRRRPRGQM